MHINKMRTNIQELENGRFFKIFPGEDFECKIAYLGNSKVAEVREAKRQDLLERKFEEAKTENPDVEFTEVELTDQEKMDISIEIIVECVLLDWKGLQDDEGEIEYSKEMALELLKDEEFALDFTSRIFEICENRQNFKYKLEQNIKKKR